ncbi:MAG TPA: GDSL-type esterase/lipase family protein [Caulifigura sp.]|nr:GDSL-type esterase/lipase family protein [Caulifigura sp.]
MILNDTFTAANGSLLTSHIAESGATYVLNPASSGDVLIDSRRAHANGPAFAASSVIAADCEIEGRFRCLSADGQHAGILGRMSPTEVAWYAVYVQLTGGVTLYGSTSFGTFAMTFTAGQDYRVKLLMHGSLIRAFINGYEFKRVTNTEVATGRVGMAFANSTTASTGMHLDSLVARVQSITPQVLFHGDSLTSGLPDIPLPHADRYPTVAMALLDTGADWASLGVPGRTVSDLLANVAEIDACRRPLAPSDIVVVWGGINDLVGEGATVAIVISRLTIYANARRALGFKVIGLTIIAADEANPGIPPEFEAQRDEVNTWLRGAGAANFDAIADVAADERLSDATDSTYFQADGVHLAAGGAAVVAEIVAAAIQSLDDIALNITAPVADTLLLEGESSDITWTSTGPVENVGIELSLDGGATWNPLAPSVANTGTYAWSPAVSQVTSSARLRITSTDESAFAVSALFRIATTSGAGGSLSSEELAAALEELQLHGDEVWGRNPILPVIARVNQEPVSKTTLIAYQRGRSLHQLVIVDSTGVGVDLSGKSLQFTLETLSGATVASTSSITISGDDSHIAALTASETWHAQPGLYRYALRDTTDGARVWARGDYLIEPTAGPV